MQHNPAKKRTNRFWLYGPTFLLALLVAGWCAGWFVMRGKASAMIDEQLAREAGAGRNWECSERAIKGFPFRFELSCQTLSFRQGDISATLGATRIVTQVYNPRHIIVEAEGPLRLTDGRVTVSGTWKALEASVAGLGSGGFDRVSLEARDSSLTIGGIPEIGETAFSSVRTALHIRPTPGTGSDEGAFDLALETTGAVVPPLNDWMGDSEPLQIQAQATLDNVTAFRHGPLAGALEEWRELGGVLKVGQFDTRKGLRILNLKADIGLDEMHRIKGNIQISQANYADLLARLTSTGSEKRPLSPLPPEAAKTPVTNLPPVQLIDGRIKLAMFDIPKVRLQPLY